MRNDEEAPAVKISPGSSCDYDVVLRAMLFAVDPHRARLVTGTAFLGRVS